jgi:hypothetical protein
MQLANKIDLESIMGFSKGEKQSAEVQEETVSIETGSHRSLK